MSHATEPASGSAPGLSQAAKLSIVGAALFACTLVIVDNFWRYHGGPTSEELAARAREQQAQTEAFGKRPANVLWKQQIVDNNISAHTQFLADLEAAVAPQPVSRCTPATRRMLRSAIVNYAAGRAGAVKLAAREPIARDLSLDKAWQTEADAQALADAQSLMSQGYLVATEFESWSDDEDAILPLPKGVSSVCTRPIDAADPADDSGTR